MSADLKGQMRADLLAWMESNGAIGGGSLIERVWNAAYEAANRRTVTECNEGTTVEAQAADVDELPPLPEAFGTLENVDSEGHTIGWVGGYSADQMRDYARAALKGKP